MVRLIFFERLIKRVLKGDVFSFDCIVKEMFKFNMRMFNL